MLVNAAISSGANSRSFDVSGPQLGSQNAIELPGLVGDKKTSPRKVQCSTNTAYKPLKILRKLEELTIIYENFITNFEL